MQRQPVHYRGTSIVDREPDAGNRVPVIGLEIRAIIRVSAGNPWHYDANDCQCGATSFV
jgi:hypothetical protein